MNFQHRALLAALIEAQANRCAYCGKPMERISAIKKQSAPNRPTLDHVLPVALKGIDGKGNMVAAHGRCNEQKRDRFPSESEMAFLRLVNTRLGWVTPLRCMPVEGDGAAV